MIKQNCFNSCKYEFNQANQNRWVGGYDTLCIDGLVGMIHYVYLLEDEFLVLQRNLFELSPLSIHAVLQSYLP